MKASHRAIARLLPLSGALLAVACVPAPEPTPAPTQTPVQTAPAPAPTPAPTPMPGPENWMDAPRTPGNWVYLKLSPNMTYSRISVAEYRSPDGNPLFAMFCEAHSNGNRAVALRRATPATDPIEMRVYTETKKAKFNASPDRPDRLSLGWTDNNQNHPSVGVSLQANEPLLDAMALTKGRFAIETPGQPTLYLPSWAEVSRVIEDCR